MIPKVSKGAPLQIAARDWNNIADAVNLKGGLSVSDGDKSLSNFGLIWVWVKNTSGNDRGRFDCMSLGDLVFNIETNAQQDIVFEAKTADASKLPVILQEPIANNRIGRAAIAGLTLAKVATASSTSHLSGTPNASGHNLTPGQDGPSQLLASPSTSAATLRPVLLGLRNNNALFRFALTATLSGSSAAATIKTMAGSTVETSTVSDPESIFTGLASGKSGLCYLQNGVYYIIQARC